MKLRKTVAIVAASTILLTGCTTDKKKLKLIMKIFKKLLIKSNQLIALAKIKLT